MLFWSVLFLSIWVLRSLYTNPIESGGDAIKKWTYVANNQHVKELLSNHHTMRWAVNLPGIAMHRLVGDRPSSYFAATLTIYSVAFVVIAMCARKLLPAGLMIACLTVLFIEPMMFRASTQFQPIVFGFMYLAAACLMAILWSEKQQLRYAITSVAFVFLAYGAKAPYGYFLPGLLVFFYWQQGKRTPLLACVAFILLFNLETLIFDWVSDRQLVLGRLSALSRTHRPGVTFQGSTYADYFLMWTRISWLNQLLTLGAIVPFWWCLATRKFKSAPPALILIGLLLTSYHLLNTFLIVDLTTWQTPQPPLVRYLAVTMPLACLGAFGWCSYWIEQRGHDWLEPVLIGAVLVLFLMHAGVGAQPEYTHNDLRYPRREAFMYRADDHFRQGARWLHAGNYISTNSPDKVAALRVFLRPYLDADDLVTTYAPRHGFLIYLKTSRGNPPVPRVAAYEFSQPVFIDQTKKLVLAEPHE